MFKSSLLEKIRKELKDMAPQLEASRQGAKAWKEEADFPWNVFVTSYATNGGSRHWEDKVEPNYKTLYSWDALSTLTPEERHKRFTKIANPIRCKPLTAALLSTYERFEKAGGPQAIKKEYLNNRTPDELITYLKTFEQIGPKYARNIPMDIYDERIRNHFAIDARIKGLLKAWGFNEETYDEQEDILRKLAQKLNVDAWTLDRLLYQRAHKLS